MIFLGGDLDKFAQQHEAPLLCQRTVRVTTLSGVRLHTLKWKVLIQCQFKEKKRAALRLRSSPQEGVSGHLARVAERGCHGNLAQTRQTFDLPIHQDVQPGDEGLFGSRVPLPIQGSECHTVV